MARRTKYPAVLLVTTETSDGDTFYLAHTNNIGPAVIGESVEVALYKFAGVKRVTTTVMTLDPPERK